VFSPTARGDGSLAVSPWGRGRATGVVALPLRYSGFVRRSRAVKGRQGLADRGDIAPPTSEGL
jgi:hypothetical protein